jgi:hypothetical protein
MQYIIYDCEIIKCIPAKNEAIGIYDYCGGWNDHANMGISVVGTITHTGEELAIVPDGDYEHVDLIALEEEAQDTFIIGFNSRNFDDRLMAAHGITIKTDYDILEQVRLAAYGSTDYRDCPKGFSYSLGKLGEANGFPKTGTGELAPQLWQQGRRQEVIDYCLNDVRLTKKILELGMEGHLVDPNTAKFLQLAPLSHAALIV